MKGYRSLSEKYAQRFIMSFSEARLARNINNAVSSFTISELTHSEVVIIINDERYELSYRFADDSLTVQKTTARADKKYRYDLSGFFSQQQITSLAEDKAITCSTLSQFITARVKRSRWDCQFKTWAELSEVKESLENIFCNDNLWFQIIVKLVNQGMFNPRQARALLALEQHFQRYSALIEELRSDTDNVSRHFFYAINQVCESELERQDLTSLKILQREWQTLTGIGSIDRSEPKSKQVRILECGYPLFALMSFFLKSAPLNSLLSKSDIQLFIILKMGYAGLLKINELTEVVRSDTENRVVKLWSVLNDPRPEAISFLFSCLETFADESFTAFEIPADDKSAAEQCLNDMKAMVPLLSDAYTIKTPGKFNDYHLWLLNVYTEFKDLIELADFSSDLFDVLRANYFFLVADRPLFENILKPLTVRDLFEFIFYIGGRCNLIKNATAFIDAINHSMKSAVINIIDRRGLENLKQKLMNSAGENIRFSADKKWSVLSCQRVINPFLWLLNSMELLIPLFRDDNVCIWLINELISNGVPFSDQEREAFLSEAIISRKVMYLLYELTVNEECVEALISAFKNLRAGALNDETIKAKAHNLLTYLMKSIPYAHNSIKTRLFRYLADNEPGNPDGVPEEMRLNFTV